MRYLDRLLGGDKVDDPSPEARAIHDGIRRAAAGDREAEAFVLSNLDSVPLWTFTVGTATDPERLMAQARLSGAVDLSFRAGSGPDGPYLAAATTRTMLLASGLGVPGDDVVTMPIQVLAWAAREGGLSLVINPGSPLSIQIGGPILATLADGLTPDSDNAVGRAIGREASLADAAIDLDHIPPRLVDNLRQALADEPDVSEAVLVRQRSGSAVVFMVLAVVRPTDISALVDRVCRRAISTVPPDAYVAMKQVDPGDPRIEAGAGGIPLTPMPPGGRTSQITADG